MSSLPHRARTTATTLCVLFPIVAAAADLPSLRCVSLQRAARIAGIRTGPDAELANLRAARSECPDDIGPLIGLLELDRRRPLPADETAGLESELAARLDEIPPSVSLDRVAWLVGLESLPERLSEHVVTHLRGRLAHEGPRARALQLLSRALLQTGRLEEASETLVELQRLEPSAVTLWTLVSVRAALSQWQDVQDLLEHGGPAETMEAKVLRLEAASRAGDVEKTRSRLDEIAAELATAPASRELLLEVMTDTAWNLWDVGRDDAAREVFERVVALSPADVAAREVLRYLYGREDLGAPPAWSQPTDANSLLDEGTRLLASGEPAAAYELLARAAPEFPELEAPWFNLGMAAYGAEKWEQAAAALARATEINPDRADSYFFRGHALFQLSRCEESVAALETTLDLGTPRALTYYYLARCSRILGNEEKARTYDELWQAKRESP